MLRAELGGCGAQRHGVQSRAARLCIRGALTPAPWLPRAEEKWKHQMNMLITNTLRDFANAAKAQEAPAAANEPAAAE